MAEIQRRKDRIQTNPLQSADLSQAIGNVSAVAQYYDQMTNSFMKIADTAVTNFTQQMIDKKQQEGEVAGREGAQYTRDEEGNVQTPKGYEEAGSLFKWDRAFNQAADSTFKQQTLAQASGFIKSAAKQANGRMDVFNEVVGTMKKEASSTVTDPEQRAFVEAAYDAEYAKSLNTVAAKGVEITVKQTKEGWDSSRLQFADDLSLYKTELAKLDRMQSDIIQSPDMKATEKNKYLKDIDDQKAAIEEKMQKRIEARVQEGANGVAIGALVKEQVQAQVREDYRKATVIAEKYKIKQRGIADKGEPYQYFYDKNLSERENQQIEEELDKYIADINTQEAVQERRDVRLLKQEQQQTELEIKTDIIGLRVDDPMVSVEETSNKIYKAWKDGLISQSTRDDYLNQIYNPKVSTIDDMANYGHVSTNIEDFSIDEIANMPGLNDSSKRKLIEQRVKWEKEGDEFTKLPSFGEGKSIISGAYGFPEKSILPEELTGDQKKRYLEMQMTMSEYRECMAEKASKGIYSNAGVICANTIMERKNNDVKSYLYRTRDEKRTVTKEDLERAIERENKAVMDIEGLLQQQYKNFPKDTYSSDIKVEDKKDATPKKEEPKGFFESMTGGF